MLVSYNRVDATIFPKAAGARPAASAASVQWKPPPAKSAREFIRQKVKAVATWFLDPHPRMMLRVVFVVALIKCRACAFQNVNYLPIDVRIFN
jgi:hypothetical protein